MQSKIHLSEWLIMFESYVKINWNTWNQIFSFKTIKSWFFIFSFFKIGGKWLLDILKIITMGHHILSHRQSTIQKKRNHESIWWLTTFFAYLCSANVAFAHCYLLNLLRSRCLFVVLLTYFISCCCISQTFNVISPFIYIN